MSRMTKVPAYCLHRASGRAVVRVFGRDVYLGQYGSPESHEAYEREITRWRAAKQQAANNRDDKVLAAGFNLTINETLARYRTFAEEFYSKDGKPTSELADMKYALRPLRILFGETLARDFGPLKLKEVRESMIDAGLSRGVVNRRVNRIRRFFKWAVAEELVPPMVCEGLRAVQGLKFGRTRAPEAPPILPVADEDVTPVLEAVSPHVAAMIQLQRYSGMRPSEAAKIRVEDIDRTGEIWLYQPSDHKNAWRGHSRIVALGPRCQDVLKPFLEHKQNGFLFSPRESETHRNASRRRLRQSPMTPSQRKRKPKSNPKRAKREYYDRDSYRRAVKYGIKKVNKQRLAAGLKPIAAWCPLQLRHSRATELNRLFGIEAAAVSLGHAHAEVTKVYAERNLELAVKVAKAAG